MGRRLRKHSLTSISIVASIALVLVVVWAGVAVGADPPTDWLQNLGFEDTPNHLNHWNPSTDGAVAVPAAEENRFPVYQTMGVTVNTPQPGGGDWMLRLGPPKDKDMNQIKGKVSVSQPFKTSASESRQIKLAYRIFSWEHRSGDTFVIEVKDANGGVKYTHTALMQVPAKGLKYWYSEWRDLTISGLPPNADLILSYTLSNPKNASHDTWVYIDHKNEAPAAGSVDITPDPAGTNDTLTAAPSGFTDPEGDVLTYNYEWSKTDTSGSTVSLGTDSSSGPSYMDLSLPGNGDKGDIVTVKVTASDGTATSGEATDSLTISNSPPVADFTWAPNGVSPHEGDVIGLYADPSSDPDGDDIVAWEWKIKKDGQTQLYNEGNYSSSPVGFIVPYDQGDYEVTLTVTDGDGAQGVSATKIISVQNHVPRVNALNIEVLQDSEAKLVGRFLDQGWDEKDGHTALWTSSGGTEIPGSVDEDHAATLSSGYVEGTVTAGGVLGQTGWSLDVNDGDGGVGTDSFTVSVIQDDPNRFENGDTIHPLASDSAYLSYIQSLGDIDIFEVKLPGGGLLPIGTEVLVTLRDLPADYDLAVFEGVEGTGSTEGAQAAPFMHSPFSTAPFMHSPFMHSPFMNSPFMNSPFMNSPFMHSPFMNSPFMNSPFMHSPFMNSPFMNSPFMNSPFMNSPFMNSPFMHSPFMHSPFMHSPFMHSPFMHSPTPAGWSDLDGYPLSSMSFTETANDNTSGIDIAFDELGFDHESVRDLRVLGFSANVGTEPEVVLVTAGYPQTAAITGHVYVAVKSAAGEYSDSPYTLQIETSRPFDALTLGQEDQDPLVTNPSADTDVRHDPVDPSTGEPVEPLTLFVTQLERMDSLYPGGGQAVEAALVSVADRPDVRGKIVSLAGNIYTDWDTKPWLVEEANEVAQSIRSEIQAQLAANPAMQYVVLVGSDRIVPFGRVIDQTTIGNEQNYTNESFLTPLSATLSSIANGYILTDDFYVDQTPIGWNGTQLYVPDLAVSRLVETPDEIAGTIQAFIDADGVLANEFGLVSGYDFMKDGAERVAQILAPHLTVDSLIDDVWTGKALWSALTEPEGRDVGSINAHFTHFAGLSAFGYNESVKKGTYDLSQLLLGTKLAEAGVETALFGAKLIFSMGCHAGLNVPDEQTVEFSGDNPVDPALDLPQAMMRQGGAYIGSTGYGYGDTVGIAGTEALIGFLAEELVDGPGSVGLALAQAKQEYLGSLSALTPYDQKSSVQFALYGMPQYSLPTTGTAASTVGSSSASLAAASVTDFRLTLAESFRGSDAWEPVDDPALPIVDRSSLSLVDAVTGQYIEADLRSEATADRPIHPVVPVDLSDRPLGPAHGFVYKSGEYPVELSPFNPAISRITNEWEIDEAEFQVATSEFWPVEPGVLTTIETPTGYEQTFVAVPAQFKPTGTDSQDNIEGIERVWSSLDVEVLRSIAQAGEPEDWLPPSVPGVEFWRIDDDVIVSVEAHDPSGISRIVALQMGAEEMYIPDGGDRLFSVTPESNRYALTLYMPDVATDDISLFIQVVDGRGNVTTLTGRGATIRWPSDDAWGLQNPGFDEGMSPWTIVTEPVADNAKVIAEDTLPDGARVTPRPSDPIQMLRLGEPPIDGNANQEKGVTAVSQTFVSDGREIVVAYRIVSVDHRVREDIFVIDVKDVYGNPVVEPLEISNVVGDPYGDSDWQTKTITGLPAGRTYTITYALNNTESASHNTWVYVDREN